MHLFEMDLLDGASPDAVPLTDAEAWAKLTGGGGAEPFPPLPNGPFSIFYADPPWDYDRGSMNNGGKITSRAEHHYPTVLLDRLKTLPVESIAADDALLFMWSSSPHLDQAIDLGKAWGFEWATVAFVWNKLRANPGYYTMSECELCVVMKKGRIPRPRGARNIGQLVTVQRGAHSAKPLEVRRRIDAMFPTQAKIELFARIGTDSEWVTWGLEASNV